MVEPKVTPWEVSGDLNDEAYEKLVKKFGVSLITKDTLKKIKDTAGSIHPFLANGIFFAHRDLGEILDSYKRGEKFYLYTGRGPSGSMHIGHMLQFIFTKWLQDSFDVDLVIQITDDEKKIVRNVPSEKIDEYVRDDVLNILSLGFKPGKTHIIIDSMHAGVMYNHAVDVSKLITASTVKAVFGVKDSDSIGKFFFPSMQIVPAFLLSALRGDKMRCLIPYGIDQDPYFRVARDVLPKLGYHKPAAIISKFIPSLKGHKNGKMSTSDPMSAIYLSDDEDTVKKKLAKYAFSGGRDTLEEQRKYGAVPEVDFAFNAFMLLTEDPKEVDNVYDEYKSGKLLSGEMKQMAADKINAFLSRIREAKKKIDVNDYLLDVNKIHRV